MQNFHKRLRERRLLAGHKTQKSFLAGAERRGHGSIPYFRYSAMERGTLTPTHSELYTICRTLGITADALLFGGDGHHAIAADGLSPKARRIVLRVVEMIKDLEG